MRKCIAYAIITKAMWAKIRHGLEQIRLAILIFYDEAKVQYLYGPGEIVSYITYSDPVICRCTNKIEYVPDDAWYVSIGGGIRSADDLPDSVREFHCVWNTHITTLNKLPPNLKKLTCFCCSDLTEINNIPHTLEKLVCYCTQIKELNLPDTIKYLSCSDTQIKELKLPANLKTLYCSNTTISSLLDLPDGIEALSCEYTNVTKNTIRLPNTITYMDYSGQPDLLNALQPFSKLRILRYNREYIDPMTTISRVDAAYVLQKRHAHNIIKKACPLHINHKLFAAGLTKLF